MPDILKKKFWIIALFFSLSVFSFIPVLFFGYAFWGGDIANQNFPLKWYAKACFAGGEFPLWCPLIFSGHPVYADPGAGFFNPTMLFYMYFPAHKALALVFAFNFFLIHVFSFLLLRALGTSFFSSAAVSTAYTYSNLFVHLVGNIITLDSLVWVPAVFYFLTLSFRERGIPFLIAAGAAQGLQLLTGEAEVVMYTMFGGVLYLLWGRFRLLSILSCVFFVFIALGVGSVQTLPALQLSLLSQRGGHPDPVLLKFLQQQLFTPVHLFFYPSLFLDSAGSFKVSINHPAYMELVLLFLLPFGFSSFKKSVWAFLFVFGLAVGFGNPFVFQLFQQAPFLRMLRLSLKAFMSLTVLSAAVLGAKGLDQVFSSSGLDRPIKKIYAAGLLWYGICLFVSFSFLHKDQSLFVFLSRESFKFVILFSALYFIFKTSSRTLLCLYVGLCFLPGVHPLFRFSTKPSSAQEVLFLTPAKDFPDKPMPVDLTQAALRGRHWDNPVAGEGSGYMGNRGILSGVFTAAGYSTVHLKRMDEIYKRFAGVDENAQKKIKQLFGVKDKGADGLPLIYLVQNARMAGSPGDALSLALDEKTDFGETVVIEGTSAVLRREKKQTEKVHLLSLTPNRMEAQVETSGGFLVFLDSFYPGWEAKDNGKQTKIYRANYLFKSIAMEPGAHHVVFEFKPAAFILGKKLTLFTLIFCLAGVLLYLAMNGVFKGIYYKGANDK